MVFGDSGIWSVFPRDQKPKITKKPIRVEFHTGALAFGYNATEPDQLRGPQFDCAWGDELAKWRYARETWDQLQFGLRLGARPRQIITTTPRPIPILKEILAAATTVVTRGITSDNAANLAPSFLKTITEKYAGTRLGRQELSAEILDDVPDALWTRAALDRDRRKPGEIPALKRIVVAIDPAAKQNAVPDDGAATGIVVAGVGDDGRGYVLDDRRAAKARTDGRAWRSPVSTGTRPTASSARSTTAATWSSRPFASCGRRRRSAPCTPRAASGRGPSRSRRSTSRGASATSARSLRSKTRW
jgi:phage terminase large subunit-like protein